MGLLNYHGTIMGILTYINYHGIHYMILQQVFVDRIYHLVFVSRGWMEHTGTISGWIFNQATFDAGQSSLN